MKLLYPTSLMLDKKALQDLEIDVQAYDVTKPIPEQHTDASILVTWGNTTANLKDASTQCKALKWIQSLAAGPNDVLAAGFDPNIIITTGSGLHDYTVAEHALTLLLAAARSLHLMRDHQHKAHWTQHLGGPQPDRPKDRFTSLRDARLLIWGYGSIAKKLTTYLTAMGASVQGIARSSRVVGGIQVHTEDALSSLLPQTDALIMILPGSQATTHALNADRLALLPKHAWIVNVGRGTSVDEDALVNAIEQCSIAGAALDVFDPEPLPSTSRLWALENVIISPHAAGGRPQGSEALIKQNYGLFTQGKTLTNVVKL